MAEKNELFIRWLVVAANLNLVVLHLFVSCCLFSRYWYAWLELSLGVAVVARTPSNLNKKLSDENCYFTSSNQSNAMIGAKFCSKRSISSPVKRLLEA